MLFPKKELDFSSPRIMGIINLTPDSFFDGNKFFNANNSLDELKVFNEIESMIEDGAHFIDIGAHSTKPGFKTITPQEELDRLGKVLDKIKDYPILFSIDTFNHQVIREAISKGIDLVNNVFSFEDKESFDLICSQNIPICICHQGNRDNKANIFEQIKIFFKEKKAEFEAGGLCTDKIIYDPGFGYGKSNFQNLDLLSNLNKISGNRILLAGLSQKKFLQLLFESSENHLNDQSLSAAIIATLGGANILRVHQVKETVNLLKNLWSK